MWPGGTSQVSSSPSPKQCEEREVEQSVRPQSTLAAVDNMDDIGEDEGSDDDQRIADFVSE